MRTMVLCLASLLYLLVPLSAWAQVERDTMAVAEDDTLAERRYLVEPYVGAFVVNDDELGAVEMSVDGTAIFGARFGWRFRPQWMFEGGYGYGPLTANVGEDNEELDGNLHLYYAAIDWMVPEEAAARFLVTAGAGGMYYAYDEFRRPPNDVLLQGTSWANEFALNFGVGLLFEGDRVGFRVDARDFVQFCQEEDEPIDETEDFSHCPLESKVLSNPSFSGGLVIRFGGGDREEFEEGS